ncbi:MAG: hypothetical protein WDN25_18420 [Acetobacteraceae bacterium]
MAALIEVQPAAAAANPAPATAKALAPSASSITRHGTTWSCRRASVQVTNVRAIRPRRPPADRIDELRMAPAHPGSLDLHVQPLLADAARTVDREHQGHIHFGARRTLHHVGRLSPSPSAVFVRDRLPSHSCVPQRVTV